MGAVGPIHLEWQPFGGAGRNAPPPGIKMEPCSLWLLVLVNLRAVSLYCSGRLGRHTFRYVQVRQANVIIRERCALILQNRRAPFAYTTATNLRKYLSQ